MAKLGAGFLAGSLVAAAGCGSKTATPVPGGGGGGTGVNIVGKVLSTGGSRLLKGNRGRHGRQQTILAGCTASAYSLTDNTVLGTGTTDSNGVFTVTGSTLTAGTPYKLVATCTSPAVSFTSIIGADSTPSDQKLDSAPTVDAQATLSATEAVKALMTAIHTATSNTSGLGASVQASVTNSLLSPANVNNLLGSISSSIDTAIATGAMTTPTDDIATSMANAVAQVTTTADPAAAASAVAAANAAETTYTNSTGAAIPVSVAGAVKGAASAMAAFPACDSTQPTAVASAAKCTVAVSQLMFNVLGFPIGLLNSGGAVASFTCADSDVTLKSLFTNFTTATVGDFCMLNSSVKPVPRTQTPGPSGGGGGGNPNFTETDGGSVGVLTAMGSALFNGTVYHLSDIDKLVFTLTSGSGMNTRLLAQLDATDFTSPPTGNNPPQDWYITSGYSLLSTSGGVNSLNSCTVPLCYNGSSFYACSPGDGLFDQVTFSSLDWSTASWSHASSSNATALVNFAHTVGTSAFSGSVFYDLYGGPIPSLAALQNSISNSKHHQDYNPTGQSQFQVLLSAQPNFNDPNCQYSSGNTAPTPWPTDIPGIAPSTQCLDQTGAVDAPVTVNVTSGTPDGTTGISLITEINNPAAGHTGAYYLFPIWTGGSFSGIFQLVNAVTGYIMTDELFNPRYIQAVMSASQCGANGLPSGGAGCAQGKLYNIEISSWNCNGGGCSPSITVPTTTAINAAAQTGAYSLAFATQYNQTQGGPNTMSHVGAQGSGNVTTPFVVTVNATTGAVTAECLSGVGGCTTAPAASSHQFFITQNNNCTCTGSGCSSMNQPNNNETWTCTTDGFYLVDHTGNTLTSSCAGTSNSQNSSCVAIGGSAAAGVTEITLANGSVCNSFGCFDNGTVLKYSDAYLTGLGSVFPTAGSPDTFHNASTQQFIFTGNVANPNYDCSRDPFYLAASDSDKTLHYSVNSTTGAVTCTTPTFNGSWNIIQAVNGMASNPMSGWGGPGACDATLPLHTGGNSCNQLPTLTTQQAALIQVNSSNAFQYEDGAAINSLLNTAFGPLADGNHSLTATTNLNSLQAFALVYMFFDGNSKGKSLPGFVPSQPTATYTTLMSPYFNSGGLGSITAINGAIGGGFRDFHQ